MKIIKLVKRGARQLLEKKRRHDDDREKLNEINRYIKISTEEIPMLNSAQEKEIDTYWAQYGIHMSHEWHRVFYAKTGRSDPHFISKTAFNHDVRPYMNDARLAGAWSDKAYLDFFIRGVRTPECVLRNVSGRFLDHNYSLVSFKTAQSIIDSYDQLVIKPTVYTHTGMGVKLLEKPYLLEDIISEYKENFVLQLPLRQHSEMAKLNASSINTIRVNSVLLEDHAYVMSCFVKVGEAGQFADNSGSKRFFIGIRTEDGCFQNYAIDHDLNRYTEIPSGYAFANQPVPGFEKLCETVCRAHECLGHFGFAFWDMCICEDREAAVVEVNLRNPDSTIAQATGGPFFGKYTEQIMEYINGRI